MYTAFAKRLRERNRVDIDFLQGPSERDREKKVEYEKKKRNSRHAWS